MLANSGFRPTPWIFCQRKFWGPHQFLIFFQRHHLPAPSSHSRIHDTIGNIYYFPLIVFQSKIKMPLASIYPQVTKCTDMFITLFFKKCLTTRDTTIWPRRMLNFDFALGWYLNRSRREDVLIIFLKKNTYNCNSN